MPIRRSSMALFSQIQPQWSRHCNIKSLKIMQIHKKQDCMQWDTLGKLQDDTWVVSQLMMKDAMHFAFLQGPLTWCINKNLIYHSPYVNGTLNHRTLANERRARYLQGCNWRNSCWSWYAMLFVPSSAEPSNFHLIKQ